MQSRYNIARVICEGSARHGTRMALVTEDGALTLAQLRDLVISLALHMQSRGIGQASCEAIDTATPTIISTLQRRHRWSAPIRSLGEIVRAKT